jgi:hypothetical protein
MKDSCENSVILSTPRANTDDLEGELANRTPYQFLDGILTEATHLINDPFSETTRARQRYLLISSVITLTLTFSVFNITKLSGLGVEGVINIHSAHLACIFATATTYLLLLFLVGAIQERGLMNLRLRYFEKQKSDPAFEQWRKRLDEFWRVCDERHQTHGRLMDELRKPFLIMNEFSAKRKLQTQPLEGLVSALGKTVVAINKLPPNSEDEDSDVRVVRETLSSQLFAQMRSISEMTKIDAQLSDDERKALAESDAESRASAEKARLVDLDKQMASLRPSDHLDKLVETSHVESLARGHLFFRSAVEIVLPTLFAVVSVAICLWRAGCFHAVSTALTTF